MNSLHLLVDGFGRIPLLIGRAMRGLDSRSLAASPAPGANSIAWLAWHAARGQDSWVADLAGTEQVWTAEGWFDPFGLPFPAAENGFGMSEDDAARVAVPADLLTRYLHEVTNRTLSYLAALTPDDLDDIVEPNRSPPVTRGIQLLSILDDNLQHAGQAGFARGILDRSSEPILRPSIQTSP